MSPSVQIPISDVTSDEQHLLTRCFRSTESMAELCLPNLVKLPLKKTKNNFMLMTSQFAQHTV